MSTRNEYDVFLCHNSEDKKEVLKIANLLKFHGIQPWLDIWHLPAGRDWQPMLEMLIEESTAAAILIGQNGFGPWQNQEMNAFLREFVSRDCTVIPVILPSAREEEAPDLPAFLKGKTWVNLGQGADEGEYDNQWIKLLWGITGCNPYTEPDKFFPSVFRYFDIYKSSQELNYLLRFIHIYLMYDGPIIDKKLKPLVADILEAEDADFNFNEMDLREGVESLLQTAETFRKGIDPDEFVRWDANDEDY